MVQKLQEVETKDVQVVYNLAFEDGITIRTYGTAVREDNLVYITDEPLKTSSSEGKRKVSIIDGEQEMFCHKKNNKWKVKAAKSDRSHVVL